jgi:L-ascorbate metabolism protein UlaG (beta-lactamase superfamily)
VEWTETAAAPCIIEAEAIMVEITWLGHSSFQLRLAAGETILLDPWLEGNPKYPHGFHVQRCDAILVSHGHFDHIASVIDIAKKHKSTVVAIYEIATWLGSKGVAHTVGMNKGGTAQVAGISATMVHALHSSSIQDGEHTIYAGEAAGYILTFPDGRRAYFAGDTTVFGDMRLIADLYQPELAFLPIGDLYTMSPKEAALACRLMRPKKVIPMHWGTFPPLTGRPEQLAREIHDLPGTSVWTLEPGVPVEW